MKDRKIRLLLADDDIDDRFFFDKALKKSSVDFHLSSVEDGEKLMNYLLTEHQQLPDALFLDLNMPRKNGSECIKEIKNNARLRHLPVIIYSTSLHEEVADLLYESGADLYIKKTDLIELQKVLHYILSILSENKFLRPPREQFVVSSARYNLPELIS